MKLLDRYIGRQIFFTTVFAVSVLTFVLVLGNVFKEVLDVLINHGVPLYIILSFIAYIVPFSMIYSIPWGFVTAVLLVFGRLSAENELIALRSNGVSITRICAPLFVLSIVCAGICLWINLDVAPRAQNNMKSALVDLATRDPLSLFGSDHVIDEFPGREIYVEAKNGRFLKNLLVYEMDKDSNILRVLFAKRGELETSEEAVLLHIYDERYEQRDPDFPDDFDKIHPGIVMKESHFSISLAELYEKNRRIKVPSQKTPGELRKELKALKAGPQNDYTKGEIAQILTEINKRYSLSLGSLALALTAVPLAITAHRKETSIGFLFSIIVGFGYFFVGQLATMAQTNPHLHPELLVWLPNIVFGILGVFLFWKLSRQ